MRKAKKLPIPPATITSGYPERPFAFTGKWARRGSPRYVARRNRPAVWNPVYMAENGDFFLAAWIETHTPPEHEF